MCDSLLGPYFTPSCLTGHTTFPTHILPQLLQDVELQTRINLWFMSKSAPPHFLLGVCALLIVLLQLWTEWSGIITWPAHSPDLQLLAFYLLQRSTISRTCNNAYIIYLIQTVQHLGFSNGYGYQCSNLQHHAFKLDTS